MELPGLEASTCYRNAQMQSKRTANTKAIEMILPPKLRMQVAVG
jgi:hypothetical protein